MNALALPLIFFLHAYHPHALPALALVAIPNEFDRWIVQLAMDYKPPNGAIAVIGKPESSELVTFLGIDEWESVPYPVRWRNRFGMVIMEVATEVKTEVGNFYMQTLLSDHRLEYIYHLLINKGKFVGVTGRKVHMVVNKDDLERSG